MADSNDNNAPEESPLKFSIQMGYDEVTRKRGNVNIVEHMVGDQESF